MRVPVRWLKEYVAWDGSVEDLAELLSMSGSEVESIDWVGAPRDANNLARFVVGKVLTRERHPNADKLNLCSVDVGAAHGGVRQIVCGAHNFEAGDVVAVSLTGAVLGNGLKLRKAAIRGIESDGMMLSEQELGYELESPGIAILPPDLPIGAPLQEYLPVAEAVLEIEVTPNRPDCLSIYGIAREVAAAAGLALAPPPLAEPPVCGAPAEQDIAVEVLAPDLCPRYTARVVRGVRMADSPPWLKARLTHAGMRPISNVVDVTNYVMLALGQPLHAFDLARVDGRRLVVRRAAAGEPIVTLDGVERRLDEDMLVIADARRPLVIAGVFGAVEAEVAAGTSDLVVEAATFAGATILRTEQRTGIRSEASSRFEKGLDAHLPLWGQAMACRLLQDICGGAAAPGTIDVHVELPAAPRLRYRPAAADALLGLTLPAAEQTAILTRLGCHVERTEDAACLAVTPPTFRSDLEREVDLIEEVGRIHGFARVPETLPRRRDAVGALTSAQRLRRAVSDLLASCGLDEVITYTFVAAEHLAALGLQAADACLTPVALANPMSAEQAVMRTTLLPGLLTTLRDNVSRQNYPAHLFELGRVYCAPGSQPGAPSDVLAGSGSLAVELPRELEAVGIVLSGPLVGENWTEIQRATDFYALKGIVDRVLDGLRAGERSYTRGAEPFLHPGKSATVVLADRPVGWLGQVRPDVAAAFGLGDNEVYAAQLSLEAMLPSVLGTALFTDLVTYPPASQDLAVVVDRDVPAEEILAAVRAAGGGLLHRVSLFDVYEGDQVPAGKRSLALRLVLRSPQRTLTEKDISGVRSRVLLALQRQFAATLR